MLLFCNSMSLLAVHWPCGSFLCKQLCVGREGHMSEGQSEWKSGTQPCMDVCNDSINTNTRTLDKRNGKTPSNHNIFHIKM